MNWVDATEGQVLTKCGKVQAAGAAKALRKMPKPAIKEIASSTMTRAVETAEIIHEKFPDVPLLFDQELEEGNPDMPHIALRFDRVYSKYFVPTQGPNEETKLLICHSNLIRYLACR